MKKTPKKFSLKQDHHLWGIRRGHHNTWEYIRPCTDDRRAITGLDPRKFSQLEVRESDSGKTVLIFVKELED